MTRDKLWIYISVAVLSLLHQSQSALTCPRGYFLHPTSGTPCMPCPVGYFMPEELHSLSECYTCTAIKTPIEILVSVCNRTHDAEIRCPQGYYRTQPSYPRVRGQCILCTTCPFPKRPCQTFNDTVCCPGDDYRVVIGKDGKADCVRECGRDQYLNVTSNKCLSCPYNTYMEELKHTNTNCASCDNPTSKKQIIVQPCNSTHPTIFGCVVGFIQQFNDEQNTSHAECTKLCGRGEYLQPETETCLPCHKNTYMDEDHHSHTARCKPCELPRSRNEAIIQACSSTNPAIIGCIDGFYRRLSPDLTTSICAPCRNCSENTDGNMYVGRACDGSDNTVCCSKPDMDVVDTLGGPVCVFLNGTVFCGESEYLITNTSNRSVTCQPCPQGSYMDETEHTKTSCKNCGEFPHAKLCSEDGIQSRNRENSHHEKSIITGLTIGIVVLLLLMIGLVILFIRCIKCKKWTRETFCHRRTRHRDEHSGHEIQLLRTTVVQPLRTTVGTRTDLTTTGRLGMEESRRLMPPRTHRSEATETPSQQTAGHDYEPSETESRRGTLRISRSGREAFEGQECGGVSGGTYQNVDLEATSVKRLATARHIEEAEHRMDESSRGVAPHNPIGHSDVTETAGQQTEEDGLDYSEHET